jgi:hypothetical protein
MSPRAEASVSEDPSSPVSAYTKFRHPFSCIIAIAVARNGRDRCRKRKMRIISRSASRSSFPVATARAMAKPRWIW